MILLELNSDINSFHKIEFKRGLNFIVGKRANPNIINTKDSYNGVGKSLIIELIHFCLGSNKIKAFQILGNHHCFLTIEHNQKIYQIKRCFANKQTIYLDNEEISINDLKKFLTKICFPSLPQDSELSFRSLISRFIRRYKQNYSVYSKYVKGEQPQNTLLNNGYLLGLDVEKILSKIKNKSEFMLLNSTKKSLKEDKLLVEYFEGKGSIDFRIKDIEDNLKVLMEQQKQFKIAENYNQIEKDADFLARKSGFLSNQVIILKHRIEKINKALEQKETINEDDVRNLYAQINLTLPELVAKTIDEVCDFHKSLYRNRLSSFIIQKQQYERELIEQEKELFKINEDLNQKIEMLSSCGALEEYNALSENISSIKHQLTKYRDYKQLMIDYEKEIAFSKKRKAEILIENQDYLDNNLDLQEKLMSTFREFSRKFYIDKPSGLSIEINSKDNKLSFDINADIEGDSSDGINEVKIFCFDMTILSMAKHNVEFLFHDSRLLSNMDPRQRVVWLEIINEYFSENSLQYIASLNEDIMLTMRDVVDEKKYEELQDIFKKNTRIYLTDENPESKLLGYQLNIKYDV